MAALTASRKQRLRTLENEIRSGMEEFYYTGMKLKEIRDDELYKEDGFESWERYCRDRWEWSARHVLQLITAAEYREKLPSGTTGSDEKKQEWSERSVRELTRIPDKREAARVAKKVVAEVEKKPETKLSASFVRKIVDEELGVKRPKVKSGPKDNGIDLREYISRHIGTIQGITDALKENIDKEAWSLFIDDNPKMVKRLATACESLAAYLRELEG